MRKAATVLLVVALAGCGPEATKAGSPPTTAQAPSSTGATTLTVPSTTTPSPLPTAYDQLAGFVQAAQKMDGQLRYAAKLINGTGPPWPVPLSPGVVSAVQAADLQPVALAIPPGLSSELLRQTILVYSDLASRRFAMRWFGPDGVPYVGTAGQAALLNSLTNGAPAAARFSSDLDGLTKTARVSSPVTISGAVSRHAAELLLLVQWTNGLNAGCASTGGTIVTTLPAIVWATRGDVDGTIAGVGFKAQLVDGSWQVQILAC
jgi:hypothetical protein